MLCVGRAPSRGPWAGPCALLVASEGPSQKLRALQRAPGACSVPPAPHPQACSLHHAVSDGSPARCGRCPHRSTSTTAGDVGRASGKRFGDTAGLSEHAMVETIACTCRFWAPGRAEMAEEGKMWQAGLPGSMAFRLS